MRDYVGEMISNLNNEELIKLNNLCHDELGVENFIFSMNDLNDVFRTMPKDVFVKQLDYEFDIEHKYFTYIRKTILSSNYVPDLVNSDDLLFWVMKKLNIEEIIKEKFNNLLNN